MTINLRGGRGGNGHVSFGEQPMDRRPSGGDGGNGGSVYLLVDRAIGDLSRFRYEKDVKAGDGERGGRNRDGENGKDIILKIPRGTVVHNRTSGEPPYELLEIGEQVLVARGGVRGRGNRAFSHARSSEPKKFEEGRDGYAAELFLELQLIADVGLVGLPNAGKSSLLNALTKAKSKVADYKFTTLEPHLGVLQSGLVMADIPGIIEGASGGKGLGTKFLRHIKRTKVILHCLAADSEDYAGDYKIIREELAKFDPALLKKKEIKLMTKKDLMPEGKKIPRGFLGVSIYDDKSLKKLNDKL